MQWCCRIITKGKKPPIQSRDPTFVNWLKSGNWARGHDFPLWQVRFLATRHRPGWSFIILQDASWSISHNQRSLWAKAILLLITSLLCFIVNTPTSSFKCCHLTSATWDPIISSEIREFISMAPSHMVIPFPQREATTDLSNIFLFSLMHFSVP